MKLGLLVLSIASFVAAGALFLCLIEVIDTAKLTIVLLFDMYLLIWFYEYKQEKRRSY